MKRLLSPFMLLLLLSCSAKRSTEQTHYSRTLLELNHRQESVQIQGVDSVLQTIIHFDTLGRVTSLERVQATSRQSVALQQSDTSLILLRDTANTVSHLAVSPAPQVAELGFFFEALCIFLAILSIVICVYKLARLFGTELW